MHAIQHWSITSIGTRGGFSIILLRSFEVGWARNRDFIAVSLTTYG